MSMTQRYQLVKSLKKSGKSAPMPGGPVEITLGTEQKGVPPTPPGAVSPETIEEQIDIEITQTQKTLTLPPEVAESLGAVDDDDDDKKSSTLLGIFRRSSRS